MIPPSFTKLITIGLLVGSLAASVQSAGCTFNALSYTGKKERYIVLLKEAKATVHYDWLKNCAQKSQTHISSSDFSSQSADKLKDEVLDFTVKGAISGYTAYFDPKFVKEQISKRDETILIELETPVSIKHPVRRQAQKDTVQKNPTPNLDRIDQQDFPLDKSYTFPSSAGTGAVIYVIDTGVLVSHKEFQGRATFGGSFCTGCPQTDDNGHGSHVAGLVAGKTFGVAKNATIIGVKVLDSNGSGSNADVVSGLMFALGDHQKKKTQNSIVNMSLGGGFSAIVNTAVKSLTDAGIHVVVASGNDGADACGSSPASEPSAITVGALEAVNNTITDFSNIGKCVDIFSPGRDIKSVGIKSNTDTAVFSGTSQATPQVAGTIALIIGADCNSTPASMADTLKGLAAKNKIKNASSGSPNLIVQVPK